jgi:hypothetical protein
MKSFLAEARRKQKQEAAGVLIYRRLFTKNVIKQITPNKTKR